MRNIGPVLLLVLACILTACAKSDTPYFGAPGPVQIPTISDIAGPRFSSGPDGQLVLSWMEFDASGTSLHFSPLLDGEFQESTVVVTDSDMFVNWADLPAVTPIDGEHWVAHWLHYSAPQTYSYDVVVSQSIDGGSSWGEPLVVHTDGTPTEHGFVSVVPDVDGAALLWLDGRNTPDQSMILRSATITRDGHRLREQEVDNSVCDCCQTDIAISAAGPVAAYRDRSSDEIRDIYVTRFTDGRWQPGSRLYADDWQIPGCPVNGPSIVASGHRTAVAWFSAADDQPVVRVIRSADSGETFGEAIEIAAGRVAGYVGLALLDDESLTVSWVEKNDDLTNTVFVRHVTTDGGLGEPIAVGRSEQLRLLPQIAFADGYLYVGWTDETETATALKLVRLRVSTHSQSS